MNRTVLVLILVTLRVIPDCGLPVVVGEKCFLVGLVLVIHGGHSTRDYRFYFIGRCC